MVEYTNGVKFRSKEKQHNSDVYGYSDYDFLKFFIFKLKEIIMNIKTQLLCFELL